jgi:hypothetical protein
MFQKYHILSSAEPIKNALIDPMVGKRTKTVYNEDGAAVASKAYQRYIPTTLEEAEKGVKPIFSKNRRLVTNTKPKKKSQE